MEILLENIDIEFTVYGISETWLKDSNCELFSLSGYDLVEYHRSDRVGGGVGLFVSNSVHYNERTDFNVFNNVYESVFIEIQENFSKNTIVGMIYRPPGSNIMEFNDTFIKTLDRIKQENKKCYLLGDWNIDLLNYESHSQTANFIDMMYSFGFSPLINRPTRISSASATIIDNIFSNNPVNSVSALNGIIVSDISDHLPIFHISEKTEDKTKNFGVVKRSFNEKNKQSFTNELANLNWDHLYNVEDFQSAFSNFHNTYFQLFDKHFPKRNINIKYNTRKPFLADGLRKCIKH